MKMLRKNLKLLVTAVGLVAVLVTLVILPGATQQTQLSRASILNAIQAAMGAQLTAAVGGQLALDAAVFFSNYYGSTWAFVPPRFLKSPVIVLAGIPTPVFNGGGTAGPLPPSPQPPLPPPPPPPDPWKQYIPGQICFTIPLLPFAEWELGCIDP